MRVCGIVMVSFINKNVLNIHCMYLIVHDFFTKKLDDEIYFIVIFLTLFKILMTIRISHFLAEHILYITIHSRDILEICSTLFLLNDKLSS